MFLYLPSKRSPVLIPAPPVPPVEVQLETLVHSCQKYQCSDICVPVFDNMSYKNIPAAAAAAAQQEVLLEVAALASDAVAAAAA